MGDKYFEVKNVIPPGEQLYCELREMQIQQSSPLDASIVSINCRNGEIKYAHRLIVGMGSPIFKNLLKENAESITLDVSSETLDHILEFIYTTQSIRIDSHKALDLFAAAKRLQVEDLARGTRDQFSSNHLDELLNVDSFENVTESDLDFLPELLTNIEITQNQQTSLVREILKWSSTDSRMVKGVEISRKILSHPCHKGETCSPGRDSSRASSVSQPPDDSARPSSSTAETPGATGSTEPQLDSVGPDSSGFQEPSPASRAYVPGPPRPPPSRRNPLNFQRTSHYLTTTDDDFEIREILRNGEFSETKPLILRGSEPIKHDSDSDIIFRDGRLYTRASKNLEVHRYNSGDCRPKRFRCNQPFIGITSSGSDIYVWDDLHIYSVDNIDGKLTMSLIMESAQNMETVFGVNSADPSQPNLAIKRPADNSLYFLGRDGMYKSCLSGISYKVEAVSQKYIVQSFMKNLIISEHDFQTLSLKRNMTLAGRILGVRIKGDKFLVLLQNQHRYRSIVMIDEKQVVVGVVKTEDALDFVTVL